MEQTLLTNQAPLHIPAVSPYGNVFDETDGGDLQMISFIIPYILFIKSGNLFSSIILGKTKNNVLLRLEI